MPCITTGITHGAPPVGTHVLELLHSVGVQLIGHRHAHRSKVLVEAWRDGVERRER